jgi:hypothetical protein
MRHQRFWQLCFDLGDFSMGAGSWFTRRGAIASGRRALGFDGVEGPEVSARRLERSLVVDASVLIEQEPAGSPRRDTR